MKKLNVITAVKILGAALTLGAGIASGWATSKENEKTLEKLVDKRLADK